MKYLTRLLMVLLLQMPAGLYATDLFEGNWEDWSYDEDEPFYQFREDFRDKYGVTLISPETRRFSTGPQHIKVFKEKTAKDLYTEMAIEAELEMDGKLVRRHSMPSGSVDSFIRVLTGRFVQYRDKTSTEDLFVYDPWENSGIRVGTELPSRFGKSLALYALGFDDHSEEQISDLRPGTVLVVKVKLAQDREESEIIEIIKHY